MAGIKPTEQVYSLIRIRKLLISSFIQSFFNKSIYIKKELSLGNDRFKKRYRKKPLNFH